MGIVLNPKPFQQDILDFLKSVKEGEKVTIGRKQTDICSIYIKSDGCEKEQELYRDDFLQSIIWDMGDDFDLDIVADRDFIFWCLINDLMTEQGFVCVGDADNGLSSVFKKIPIRSEKNE